MEQEPADDLPVITVDNVAAVTASAACEQLAPCCAADGLGFDRTRCEEELAAEYALVPALVEAGRAILDTDAARRCILELRESLRTCQLRQSRACRDAVRGTVPPGESCTHYDECAGSEDGVGLCNPEEQTCGFLARRTFGEPCGQTCVEFAGRFANETWPAWFQHRCESYSLLDDGKCFLDDGLYCSRNTGNCERLLPVGSACVSSACQNSLFCDGETCRPRLQLGDACPVIGLVGQPCEAGLTCLADGCQPDTKGLNPLYLQGASICAPP